LPRKGLALIFLAFFLPLAVYLLVLGRINRRRRPLLVPGTWDFLGLLFAASGFLLFGGPALLSSAHERWRLSWRFGHGWSAAIGPDATWAVWYGLFALYFVAVVAAAARLLARRRRQTSIYNVAPAAVPLALAEVCEQLGLDPVRSGNLFLFGLTLEEPAGRRAGTQAPPHLPLPAGLALPHGRTATAGPPGAPLGEAELLGPSTILEVEPFPLMRHVTLRWGPADSPLRPEVERELARRLARTAAPPHDVGGWLTLAGLFLLAASLLGAVMLTVRWYLVT
jgi:hypothetical protein